MNDGTAHRLELRNITKRFPGVVANSDVSLAVRPGEIHALLGENGAGKSTLVKIIYGVQQADEGDILWDGRKVHIPEPKAARKLGIGMVFQHFSLFEAMTVLENVALGMDEPGDMAALADRIREVSRSYGLPLDPTREVHTLSVGERQRIEIVRCLLQSPRLLIMDEPTSVLTPQEVDKLFETLRRLSREGVSILYISHKLVEIEALCEAATILRGGRVVGAADPRQTPPKRMAEMMIGAELKTVTRKGGRNFGEERLVVNDMDLPGAGAHGTRLKDVSMAVRAGEIFGIAGVAGNGQNELLLALSGEALAEADAVKLDGAKIGNFGPGERRRRGLCAVPEERNGHAAVPDFSLAENTILTARTRMELASGAGFLRLGAATDFAASVIGKFDVRTTGPAAAARSLSGGNLQKFIVGREIGQNPEVLVVSQPTWGVDAGAAAAIHQALIDLAASGSAIVVISQDLDELLAISDRIAVINVGRLSEAMNVEGVSIEKLGLLMGGVHGETPAKESAHVA